MSIYYDKKRKTYAVYRNNKKIASYSKGRLGKYAKILALKTLETGNKYKNYYEISNNIVYIKIYSKTHGYHNVIIDLDDFENVSKFRWSVIKGKGKKTFYCKTVISKNKNMLLHRFITKYKGTNQIDHIDRNGLNNSKSNLRIVNQSKNQKNTSTRISENSFWKNVTYRHDSKSFLVVYTDFNNKLHTKKFSINKYGYDKALHKAIKISIKKRCMFGYVLSDMDREFIKVNKLKFVRKIY